MYLLLKLGPQLSVNGTGLRKHLPVTLLLLSAAGFAQQPPKDPDTQEPVAIVELGGAQSWNINGGSGTGGDVAVEFTPIENWLEIEIGTTPLFASHSVEWDTDAMFKKPWTLSKKAEFMIGIGPEWVHTRQFGVTRNAFAGEFGLDFMYWPGARHRTGWFIEPAYEYTFGYAHERSVGISWGLLIAIGK